MNTEGDDECTCDVGFGDYCPTCIKYREIEIDKYLRKIDEDNRRNSKRTRQTINKFR